MHGTVPNRYLTMALLPHVSMTCSFLNLRRVFNTISIQSRKTIIRNKRKEGRMLEWQGKERKESPMPVSKEKVNCVCPYLTLKALSFRMMIYKQKSIDSSAEVQINICHSSPTVFCADPQQLESCLSELVEAIFFATSSHSNVGFFRKHTSIKDTFSAICKFLIPVTHTINHWTLRNSIPNSPQKPLPAASE